eukprot:gene25327-biopygen11988
MKGTCHAQRQNIFWSTREQCITQTLKTPLNGMGMGMDATLAFSQSPPFPILKEMGPAGGAYHPFLLGRPSRQTPPRKGWSAALQFTPGGVRRGAKTDGATGLAAVYRLRGVRGGMAAPQAPPRTKSNAITKWKIVRSLTLLFPAYPIENLWCHVSPRAIFHDTALINPP